MNKLNKDLIRDFWRHISLKESNRWTTRDTLNFEITYLSDLIKNCKILDILDLGSGSGELSREIMRKNDKLIAVDYEPTYSRFYNNFNNEFFHCQDLLDYSNDEKFGLILLFGVVTHLELHEETLIYRKIKSMISQPGYIVIKNQVSLSHEIVVNDFSNDLGVNYSARYPSLGSQQQLIWEVFGNVRSLVYPKNLNRFKNTINVAFIIEF